MPGLAAGVLGWAAGGIVGLAPLPAAVIAIGFAVLDALVPGEPEAPVALLTAAEPAWLVVTGGTDAGGFTSSESEQADSTRHAKNQANERLSRSRSGMAITQG